MKRLFVCICVLIGSFQIHGQQREELNGSQQPDLLFDRNELLLLKLSYSPKKIKKETRDGTYVSSSISYAQDDGTWRDLTTKVRVRGNFRLEKCYFPPLKLKISKEHRKETLFEENKKIKLVTPCYKNKKSNDYILKEYIAYRFFEMISPFHLKSRLARIEMAELSGNKTEIHELMGILLEDDEKAAERVGGEVLEKSIHIKNHEPLAAARLALFQFMIGNTDFSTAYQHNAKLFLIEERIVPVPYDFDMCGLVDANYAVVSNINGEALSIKSVTERAYRGVKRRPEIMLQVRNEFLARKADMLALVEDVGQYFENQDQFIDAREYVQAFFDILESDERYDQYILEGL